MNINKNDNSRLFNEYEISKAISKGQLSIPYYVSKMFEKRNTRFDVSKFATNYCNYNGIESSSEQEKLGAFMRFNHKLFSKLYGNFKVEVIAESFYDNLNCSTAESVLEKHKLYDLLGECSGVLLFPENGFVEYVILKEGSFMRYIDGDEESEWMDFSYILGGIANDWLNTNDYHLYFLTTLKVLLMKKYSDIETIMVAKDTIRAIGNARVANRMPFPIFRLDSSYFKTIIRTEGFLVRSHWRLQPCGVGRKKRKLIFINSFQKHGYVRRAPALIARQSA